MIPASDSYRDQLLDLAEAVGQLQHGTDGSIDLPTSAYELGKLQRKYHQGLNLLIADNPDNWYCLRRLITIDFFYDGTLANHVNDDNRRIILPAGICSQPIDEVVWAVQSGADSGLIEIVDWSTIVRRNALNQFSGRPQLACVMPCEDQPSSTGANRWEMRLYPKPDRNYYVYALFAFSKHPTLQGDDRHLFGPQHDEMVNAAARWAYVKTDPSDARYDTFKAEYEQALARGIALDAKNAPKKITDYPKIEATLYRVRGLDTFNGTSQPVAV